MPFLSWIDSRNLALGVLAYRPDGVASNFVGPSGMYTVKASSTKESYTILCPSLTIALKEITLPIAS
jgi:hypothetical protein